MRDLLGPAIAGRAHEGARGRVARLLLHRRSARLARVRDDAKPISGFTRIGEKVERLGREAFGCIDGHASGLAVGAVGVDHHARRGCGVAAVSVSLWEWDVWHSLVKFNKFSAPVKN